MNVPHGTYFAQKEALKIGQKREAIYVKLLFFYEMRNVAHNIVAVGQKRYVERVLR